MRHNFMGSSPKNDVTYGFTIIDSLDKIVDDMFINLASIGKLKSHSEYDSLKWK